MVSRHRFRLCHTHCLAIEVKRNCGIGRNRYRFGERDVADDDDGSSVALIHNSIDRVLKRIETRSAHHCNCILHATDHFGGGADSCLTCRSPIGNDNAGITVFIDCTELTAFYNNGSPLCNVARAITVELNGSVTEFGIVLNTVKLGIGDSDLHIGAPDVKSNSGSQLAILDGYCSIICRSREVDSVHLAGNSYVFNGESAVGIVVDTTLCRCCNDREILNRHIRTIGRIGDINRTVSARIG